MVKKPLKVLQVEDSERDAALLRRHLTQAGYDLTTLRVELPETMRQALEEESWDLILCDYSMPHFSALAALKLKTELGSDIPFIVISGTIGEEAAVEAMHAGAQDYLMKDKLARLAATIERELKETEVRRARREAEQNLIRAEEKYRGIFENAIEGIFQSTADGQFIAANPALARILGFDSPDELITQRIDIGAQHYTDPTTRAKLARLLSERDIVEGFECEIYRKDGSTISALESVRAVRDAAGELLFYEGSIKDETERIRNEAEQRRLAAEIEGQRRRLNDVVANVPGIVWETWAKPDAAAQHIEFASNYVETMVGYTVDEWLSQPKFWLSIIHPDDQKRIEREFAASFAAGTDAKREFRWITKDGRIIWVESTSTIIKDDEGRSIGVRGVTVDVTERKNAEEELRKSEERYRELVENAHDVIYTHDMKGNYITVNTAVERIAGYTRDESLTMNLAQVVAPESQEVVRAMIAKKLAGEEITAYDLEIIAKDGHRVAVEVNTRLIRENGVPVGVQGIARDVTERRLLEEQLRQAQKMEAVGLLAGGIAHDFNNLLTVICGYCDLSLRSMPPEDPLYQKITEIRKAGTSASALTRQLLAFSRKQVLQPKVLNLNTVVNDLEKLLRRLIGEDVGLRVVLDSGIGNVKADPGQIEQILMNLAVNARDAMPGGGKLTIETQNVFLDAGYAKQHVAVTPGRYVMIAVSDTGTGMDQETLRRIFEPFFTTKEAGKGTGLGLSTVYGIVKQSGGNIWVYSEPGQGTSFKVYLPRVDEAAQTIDRTVQSETLQGKETILLVEDDEMLRRLSAEVLELYGYQVLQAANGGSALLICERHPEPIELLVTDVIMPEMGGREAADRLAQLRPDMKVLFMSGYTDNAIVHQGVLDDDTNFIQKPFAPDALARKVREVLDRG